MSMGGMDANNNFANDPPAGVDSQEDDNYDDAQSDAFSAAPSSKPPVAQQKSSSINTSLLDRLQRMDSDRTKEKQRNDERHKNLQNKFEVFQREMDVQLTALGDAVAKMHDDMKEARETNFNQFATLGNQMAQLMQAITNNSSAGQSSRKENVEEEEPRRKTNTSNDRERSPHRGSKVHN